jgi:hypothetical protein
MSYSLVQSVGPTTRDKDSSNNTHPVSNSSPLRHLLSWPAITKRDLLIQKSIHGFSSNTSPKERIKEKEGTKYYKAILGNKMP